MGGAFPKRLPGRSRSLWKGDHPSIVQRDAYVGDIAHFYLSLNVLPVGSPGTLNADRSGVGQDLREQAFFHGLLSGHIIDIQLGPPQVADILDRILATRKTGVEDMEHGNDICKIGLMVADEQDPVRGQGPDDLGPIDLQPIKPLVALMRQQPHNADQPFFQE